MTEEQMLPEFKRVLQGKDSYGNTVMHYFDLRNNDEVIAELLRGCMCIHNHAGQSAIDVRKTLTMSCTAPVTCTREVIRDSKHICEQKYRGPREMRNPKTF